MTQENFKKYFTVYFIIFGIVISLFSAFTSYMFQMQDIQERVDTKAEEIFEIKTKTILEPMINNMDNILKSLSTNEIIREFIIKRDLNKENELEHIFLAVAGVENKIMQARILDKYGKEIIRVDRKDENSQPFIIEKANLQDKSDRDYFQKLSKTKTEAIWHSKLDLNIENNEVEIPYKPTIRIAISVFDKNQFCGVIIVNLLINNVLEAIGRSSAFEHFIIDKENNYILHPNEKYSLNKYKGIERKLKDDFPDELNTKKVYSYPINNILKNDDEAIFILKTNENYEDALIYEILKTTIIVFIMTIFLSLITAIFVSKKPNKLQNSLLKTHKKLKEFTAIIDRYIITATTKPDSTILDVSTAFIESSGYSKDELIGMRMDIIKNKNRDKYTIKDLWQTISAKKTWIGEIQNRKKDGTTYWLEQHIIPTINENNNIDSFVSIGIDITAKKELEKLATLDKLTGIYNRRRIDEFLQIEIEVAKRHFQNLVLIIVDIDHFKIVNDTYGHQTGDMVLQEITKIISRNLRKSDVFGRWGGEEFVIICPQTDKNEALIIAEKIRVAVENHKFKTVGHKTICLGIANLEDNDNDKTIIERADKALYEAKNSGRNRTIIYGEK